MNDQNAGPKATGRKQKPVTAAYLERAALHYLGRFNSSEANLRTVLVRKVQRRTGEFSVCSDHHDWIAEVAAKCVRLGYVNDENYARGRIQAMLVRGKPVRAIRLDLRQKGIDADLADRIFAEIESQQQQERGEEQDLNMRAASAYVKRRRFAAFRRSDRCYGDDKLEKEKAAMARAGFSFDVINRIFTLDQSELEELLY